MRAGIPSAHRHPTHAPGRATALLCALGGLTLAGCAGSGGGEGPAAAPAGGSCEVERFQQAIGGPLLSSGAPTPGQGPFLRVSDLPHPHRILIPGSAATTDYRPERLTIYLDTNNRIERLVCG